MLDEHDLERWLFTQEVIIQSFVKPQSHPTLTLNTRQLDSDDGQLGTFLHEQFHWFASSKLDLVNRVIEEFSQIYPRVPVGPPEGAKDEYSTYLHLIVCALEFDALALLLGKARATAVVDGRDYYRWVYQKVVEDKSLIREVLEKHQLGLP